jgi:putative transposase
MGRAHGTDFKGAIHHVIARCNNREPWALEDRDHRVLRRLLFETAERFGWVVLAYCQMSNHYHLLVQTPHGNLGASMHSLNRSFAGWFNYTYHRVGHVFQDRYIAILVEEEMHLVRTFRYVLRNPVAAGISGEPADWKWSSARAVVGREVVPGWLDWAAVAEVLGALRASCRSSTRATTTDSPFTSSILRRRGPRSTSLTCRSMTQPELSGRAMSTGSPWTNWRSSCAVAR